MNAHTLLNLPASVLALYLASQLIAEAVLTNDGAEPVYC